MRSIDGEGKPGTKEHLHSDKQARCQSDTIAVSELFGSILALSGADAPAPPKGEPLACRAAFAWTLKARYGAKGRALLQRAGFPLYNLSVIADAMPPLLVGEALAVPAK